MKSVFHDLNVVLELSDKAMFKYFALYVWMFSMMMLTVFSLFIYNIYLCLCLLSLYILEYILLNHTELLLLSFNDFCIRMIFNIGEFLYYYWNIEYKLYLTQIEYFFKGELKSWMKSDCFHYFLVYILFKYMYMQMCIFFNTSVLKYFEYFSIISLQLFLLFLSMWTSACGPSVSLDQLSSLTWKEFLIMLMVMMINLFLMNFFL